MDLRPSPTPAPPGRLVLVAVLALGLYLPGLGLRSLWNPDEPRFGEVIRAMDARGEWATPYLNGEPYSNKPVGYFWAGRVAALVTGEVDEASVRLPSALAAAGVLVLTFALGWRLGGEPTAWLAAVVLATNHRFHWQATWAQLDMLLTLFVVVAVAGYARAARLGRVDGPAFVAIYGGAAFGTLTKGLPGIVLPGLVAFVDVARRGAWRELPRYRIPSGALFFSALAVPWFVAMHVAHGPSFLDNLIVRQHFERFVDAFDHAHGPLYYLVSLPLEAAPWSLVLPAVLVMLTQDRALRRRLALPLGWFAALVLFFSLSGSKRSQYILPAYPALALMVGATLSRLGARVPEDALGDLTHRWASLPLAWFARLAGALLVGAPLLALGVSHLGVAGKLCLIAAPVAGAALLATGTDAVIGAARATAVAFAGLALVTRLVVLPGLVEPHKSPHPFLAAVLERVGPDGPLACYQYWRGYFNFYLHRDRIAELWDAAEAADALREGTCLIARTKTLDELAAAYGAPLEPVVVRSIGSHELALLCPEPG